MSTERIYLNDPSCFEFTADVTSTKDFGNGRMAIVLDRTCFFPTGGGQDHDGGTLDGLPILDVVNGDNGDVIHVIEGAINKNRVIGKIDVARRLAFMQHHSAQHLVSAILDRRLGLETVSSHIAIESPTTIDISGADISDADIVSVEDEANSVVREDRSIQSFTITNEQVSALPFRRPPKVSGEIRVVQIEGADYSACGGTHCTRTGMIGLIKIVRAEHRGDKTRIHLVAGSKALESFRSYHSIVTALARQLDTNPEGIPEKVAKLSASLDDVQKELGGLRARDAEWEARDLIQTAKNVGNLRLVTALWRDRAPAQVRGLASLLQNELGLVSVLATYDGMRITLTTSCAADTGVNASEFVRRLSSEVGGRGGGDALLAQGGGAASEQQVSALLNAVAEYLSAFKSSRGSKSQL